MRIDDHTPTLIAAGYDDGPFPRRYYEVRCACGWTFASEGRGKAGKAICQIRHGEHLVAVSKDKRDSNK